jgi:hypothetical protein
MAAVLLTLAFALGSCSSSSVPKPDAGAVPRDAGALDGAMESAATVDATLDAAADGAAESGPAADGAGEAGAADAAMDAGLDSGETTTIDGGHDAAPYDGGPTHTPFPVVRASMPAPFVLSHPQIVTVTFSDDANATTLQSFGAWVPTSGWLSTVGADYGVGAGTGVAAPLAFPADSSLGDAGATNLLVDQSSLVAFLQARIADHSLPFPEAPSGSAPFGDTLYVVNYDPSHAVLGTSAAGGAHYCAFATNTGPFGTAANPGFGFAVVQYSAANLQDQIVASHEIIEAATDPCGTWGYRGTATDAWTFIGDEVGDMCPGQYLRDPATGFYCQRAWSNSSAASDADPCVPAPPRAYQNVSPSPDAVQSVAAGQSEIIALTGWTSSAGAPWPLAAATEASPGIAGCTFDPMPTLSATQVGDGQTVQLTLTVPSGTPSLCTGIIRVSSGTTTMALGKPPFWPIAVHAQ